MSHKNIRLLNIISVYAFLPVLLILSDVQVTHAQVSSENREQVSPTRVNFQPPEKEAPADSNSTSGGSRGGLGLALLLPRSSRSLGLTTKAKPIFFVYIPESEIQEIDLILLDQETQEIIYEKTISISGNPGVIGIRLTTDAPSLEVGKTYKWTVFYRNSFMNGLIKRVELNPSVSRQLEGADPLEKAILYAENGIWFDTLEVLAELKRSQPENEIFATEWIELLKSVGLDAISTKYLLE